MPYSKTRKRVGGGGDGGERTHAGISMWGKYKKGRSVSGGREGNGG